MLTGKKGLILQKLLQRTKIARLEGSMHKLLDRIEKSDLLILDDFGLVNLHQQQRLDLMEIIEDRHARSSTIIASQLPVASWYDVIGEDTIADAVFDRIVYTSHRIELKVESLRKKSNIVRLIGKSPPDNQNQRGQHHRNMHQGLYKDIYTT